MARLKVEVIKIGVVLGRYPVCSHFWEKRSRMTQTYVYFSLISKQVTSIGQSKKTVQSIFIHFLKTHLNMIKKAALFDRIVKEPY